MDRAVIARRDYDLMMESLGRVIGAPNAAERATVVTVLALGISPPRSLEVL